MPQHSTHLNARALCDADVDGLDCFLGWFRKNQQRSLAMKGDFLDHGFKGQFFPKGMFVMD
ncbi:hypothetical protein [Pricia antarctica]|uniref:hypothetical protein n=1 Tax=Pricia antarctica TaxID=641691 RepID=UPI000B89B1D5|nr:hypothetical protein [Pricia antarctica]